MHYYFLNLCSLKDSVSPYLLKSDSSILKISAKNIYYSEFKNSQNINVLVTYDNIINGYIGLSKIVAEEIRDWSVVSQLDKSQSVSFCVALGLISKNISTELNKKLISPMIILSLMINTLDGFSYPVVNLTHFIIVAIPLKKVKFDSKIKVNFYFYFLFFKNFFYKIYLFKSKCVIFNLTESFDSRKECKIVGTSEDFVFCACKLFGLIG